MADTTIEIEGAVDTNATEYIGGFEGEDPAWVQAYLARAAGTSDVQECRDFAKATAALLQERRHGRATARAREEDKKRAELAAAIEKVRTCGTYVDDKGELFDVSTIEPVGVVWLRARTSASESCIAATTLVDPEDLLEEQGLRAAPEHARRDLLARLKIAGLLGASAEEVDLSWDKDPFEQPDARILDIEVAVQSSASVPVLRLRPNKRTWLRIKDAGAPVVDYDAAKPFWVE